MAQQDPAHDDSRAAGDPWHAFGYIVSGVAFYGLLGWLADRWLGTSFLVAVGILLGAGLGVYMTWARFRQEPQDPHASSKNVTTQE
jgi:F0F1-type ATP synthase assembly protein I